VIWLPAKQKIFITAVSGQFKDCRDALRNDLAAKGVNVVVQEDFIQHGRTLLEKLEIYIASLSWWATRMARSRKLVQKRITYRFAHIPNGNEASTG
jgi:hypothetical protein